MRSLSLLPESTSYTLPVVLSVGMHLLLLAVVAWGWEFSAEEQKVSTPRYIEAKFVELKAKSPAAAPPKPDKVIDLAAQRAAEEKRRQAEAAKRREEQQRQAQAQQEREKQEAERREQERLAREKAEQEAQAEARQQRLEQELTESLQEEEQMLQAEQAEATAQSYTALITQRIGQNWSRPPTARTGMTTRLRIELVPTGRVVGVSVVESSGNSAFDRSAEQAVWKSEQFPELRELESAVFEEYFRQFTVLFDPQDLRL